MGPMSRSLAWACFHSSGVSCGFSRACVILDKTLKLGGTIGIELSPCVPLMRADLISNGSSVVVIFQGTQLRASVSMLCLPLQ